MDGPALHAQRPDRRPLRGVKMPLADRVEDGSPRQLPRLDHDPSAEGVAREPVRVVHREGRPADARRQRLVEVDARIAQAAHRLAHGVEHLDAGGALSLSHHVEVMPAPVGMAVHRHAAFALDPADDRRRRGLFHPLARRRTLHADADDVMRLAAPSSERRRMQLDAVDDQEPVVAQARNVSCDRP